MTGIAGLSLTQAAAEVRAGRLSARELVQACLLRIEQWEPHIAALPFVMAERSLAEAAACDAEAAAGDWRGPLHGVPIVVKDLIDVAGAPTEAGSRQLAGNVAGEDATVIRRLRGAGAIILAKSNTHEFAYGALTPPTRNPWDTSRMPGGSSGGSGAAVASGEAFGALGTDSAGSVREPSALCGLTGLKPTYGNVSCRGVVPLAWSLDTVGPMTRTIDDSRVLIDAMVGRDPADPATRSAHLRPSSRRRLRRVALLDELMTPMQPEVEAVLGSVLDRLSDAGAEIEQVKVVDPDEVIATIFVILASEASAYHRRWLREHPERYGDDVLAYLGLGMRMAAVDYVDAQRLRAVYRDRLDDVLGAADLVLAPAQHVTAPFPDKEELVFADGTVLPRDLTLIRPLSLCSLTGHPAAGIPVGWSPDGLPVGIQVIGRPHAEHDVLDSGGVLQELAGWEPRSPQPPNTDRGTP